MELIDKNKVVAELERIKKEECPTDTYEGRCKMLWFEQFSSFLDTLEVKEMDLEKEVRKFIKDNCISLEEPDEFLTTVMQLDDMVIFAKHFYELGLRAKGE